MKEWFELSSVTVNKTSKLLKGAGQVAVAHGQLEHCTLKAKAFGLGDPG